MLLLSHLRTLFTTSCIALAITACGGSSGGASPADNLQTDDPIDNQPASIELLGDDIDSDGIRDDIQMMIESEYGGSLETMRAFKRMAVIDRKVLEVAHNREQLQTLASEHRQLLYCFFRSFESYPERIAAIRSYRHAVRNTAERVDRGLLMDGRLNAANSGNQLPTLAECP